MDTIEIKKIVIAECKKTVPLLLPLDDESIDNKMFKIRSSLRLTYTGLKIMEQVFSAYHFRPTARLTAEQLMGLGTLEFPYYISTNSIVLFSDSDAMMAKLEGSINLFLKNAQKYKNL